MKNRKKKEKSNRSNVRFLCFTGTVLLLSAGCSISIWRTPDRTYSSQERRMLAERPSFTKKSVLKGKFQQKYEVYLTEQFPGRDQWVTLQTKLSRLLGNKDANGVYFGKDGYLLERYQEQDFDWAKVEENIEDTASFLQAYPQAKVMFVPVKSSVMKKKLPLFAQISGEERFYELAGQIPENQQIFVSEALKEHEHEYIYYRTDHHWTTRGAYYAYELWAREMGFEPLPQEAFQVTEVCDTFLGTTFAKVRTDGHADTISLYERKNGPAYEVDYNMGEFQSESCYDLTKLSGDDPYSVFFGGNQAVADIRMKGAQEDGKTLLVIKDSFGNCFAPFAANHYARTVVVDLRYVNVPVSALLRVYPADDILILYNSAQFMEDREIHKLK